MISRGSSPNERRRIQGRAVSGPTEQLKIFSRLGATTQLTLFREAVMYGETRLTLNDEHWSLHFRPDHSFELRAGLSGRLHI
jgi:hypothetical protein